MHVVILERNKLVARKVARLFMAVGASALTLEDPAQVAATLDTADVLCADVFDGELVAEHVRARPRLRGVLWTAEPLRRALKFLGEAPRIVSVLARKDFESSPRAWEVVMLARRLVGGAAPGLGGYLDFGFSSIEVPMRGSADRDPAVAAMQTFVAALQVPRRIGEMVGELAHELVMNAVYDAPVDALGQPKYAADRKAVVALAHAEQPAVRLGTDGTRLVFQIRDPFGRLERRHVVDGLARGLAGGEQDRAHGGAGLGMFVCHNAASGLWFDVARGRHTEITALVELDLNLRELRTQAKSLHLWST